MNRVGVALLTISHTVDDLYQGAVPALLPFLVAERHYSYAAASGLVLAGNLFSSIAQPAFGALTDRFRLWWLVGVGMSFAGIGVGLSGLASSYQLTWLAIALSGLGVAAFHPEAARSARVASGGRQIAMSWFGFGGNVGLTIGPLLVTPVLLTIGLRGTAVLTVPALLVGASVLSLHRRVLPRAAVAPKPGAARTGRDDWPGFARLTVVIVTRAVLFFGLTSFLALYITRQLGGSQTLGEAALALFLGCGALGTLLGGHLADRLGRLPVLRVGYALMIPPLLGLVAVGRPWVFVFIVLSALTVYLPFAVQVTLSQDMLPNRVGTASGVSLGLAITAGGLLAPLFGALADATTLRTTLLVLVALPVLALLLSGTLRDPRVEEAPALSGSRQGAARAG
ncbi:MAG TPA: MFS transporter [Actinomycetota bacterium]|nr:MFS transporter [Actinomycetota bacterium]